MKRKDVILLMLFLLSGILYYNLFTENTAKETIIVGRVIDGDTIETNTKEKIRLKGINTPESTEPYFEEAKNYLIENYENKSLEIEISGTDRYGRILAYSKANKELLENGLAYLYYYEKDSFYNELSDAEEDARKKELGLWKNSPNKDCLELIELTYKENPKRCSNSEVLILENSCNYGLDVIIKDDATHIYKENINANSIFQKNFSCIWNDAGDSVYIRDEEGLLIFHRYS